jgi:hypothetical protein
MILARVIDAGERHRLAHRLHVEGGGYRGLFDPFCAEWGKLDMSEKRTLLIEIQKASNMSLKEIVDRFRLDWAEDGRTDVSEAAIDALKRYAQLGPLP